ncbi:MAG: extensin family protein [Neomegalonema sp.]|nr:extensin family protein [Neomegalonema sp.]
MKRWARALGWLLRQVVTAATAAVVIIAAAPSDWSWIDHVDRAVRPPAPPASVALVKSGSRELVIAPAPLRPTSAPPTTQTERRPVLIDAHMEPEIAAFILNDTPAWRAAIQKAAKEARAAKKADPEPTAQDETAPTPGPAISKPTIAEPAAPKPAAPKPAAPKPAAPEPAALELELEPAAPTKPAAPKLPSTDALTPKIRPDQRIRSKFPRAKIARTPPPRRAADPNAPAPIPAKSQKKPPKTAAPTIAAPPAPFPSIISTAPLRTPTAPRAADPAKPTEEAPIDARPRQPETEPERKASPLEGAMPLGENAPPPDPETAASRCASAALIGVAIPPLTDPNEALCGAARPIKLTAIKTGDRQIRLSPAPKLACDVSQRLAVWIDKVAAPAALEAFGEPLVRVATAQGYYCRRVNFGDKTKPISEHAKGNAIDISAFILQSGRRITVLKGWPGAPEEQAFLRKLWKGACEIFGTVLGPEADKYHLNHFHFDAAARRRSAYCR